MASRLGVAIFWVAAGFAVLAFLVAINVFFNASGGAAAIFAIFGLVFLVAGFLIRFVLAGR